MRNSSIKYFFIFLTLAVVTANPMSVFGADPVIYRGQTLEGQTLIRTPDGRYVFPPPTGNGGSTLSSTDCRKPENLSGLFIYAYCVLVGYAIPFLIVLGGVIFMVGVLKYITAGDNEEKRQAGRQIMIFGVIALFVLVSVWGLVRILTQSFFGTDPQYSSLPKQSTTVFEQ